MLRQRYPRVTQTQLCSAFGMWENYTYLSLLFLHGAIQVSLASELWVCVIPELQHLIVKVTHSISTLSQS